MKKLIAIALTGLILFPLMGMSQSKELQESVKGSNEFCYDWMKSSYKKNENLIFSPQSVSIAMSMAYDGARWKTKSEMAKVMHFHKNTKKNQEAWAEYIRYFDQIKTPLFYSANAAWAQKDFNFLDSYMKGLENYNAKIKAADFINTTSREEARKKMNQWVESKTKNKIQQLIRKGDIDDQTRLVLINAIYFNAEWKTAFPVKNTETAPFYNGENKYKCEFMRTKGEFMLYEDDNIQVIEIPYASDLSSMIIILPKQDKELNNVLGSLGEEMITRIDSKMEKQELLLSLPKFKLESRIEMKEQFKAMGIINAFASTANFKGMNGKKNLMIDEVIHQAVIELDEEGTEASAATAVVVREKSATIVPAFNANRPFIFMIRENKLGSILFAGIFEQPNI